LIPTEFEDEDEFFYENEYGIVKLTLAPPIVIPNCIYSKTKYVSKKEGKYFIKEKEGSRKYMYCIELDNLKIFI